jgi:PAS domain S-box-containing protein
MVRLTIDGEFDGVAAVARDVTDRKRREHELERYETIVEASGDVVYTLDAEGCLTFVNDTVRDLTGYEPADLVGEHISAMMDPADVERGQRHVRSLLSGDRQHTIFEMEVITADGEHVPCENHVALLPYETTFRGTVGVLRDITRRKEIEEELRQYQRAVEGANDLIAAVDPDYRFLFANRRYREFHGADAAITGVHLGTVLDDDAYETARPYIERAMDGEEVGHRARRSWPAQGDRIFDIRYAPLRDADGGIAGVVNTMRDITDRTDRERQLDVLDRVLRHNLHNEMNVMVGYAETIREEVSGDHREWADRIVRSGEKLLELADKEREIVELITEPRAVREFDVAALVRGAVDPYLDAHPDATVDFDVPADASIRTLPEMETAVMELVENALDHAGSEPMVHITVTAADERVVIRIADDGPGIPPLERDILTGDVEIDTLHHGSGMGLWLVNWIVTLGGGRLDFEENDPRGSVVTLSLPRELSEERMSTTTTPVR